MSINRMIEEKQGEIQNLQVRIYNLKAKSLKSNMDKEKIEVFGAAIKRLEQEIDWMRSY